MQLKCIQKIKLFYGMNYYVNDSKNNGGTMLQNKKHGSFGMWSMW